MPNTNSPDVNFGKCMQCVTIDRARYKVNPPLARSSVCTQCFQQYCFDANNQTSASELPGRKLAFVDPDPQGFAAVSGFLSRSRVGLILGFIALLLVVAALSAFLWVYFPLPQASELIPTSYILFFVVYGENVGRTRLNITRWSSSTMILNRHFSVTVPATVRDWCRTTRISPLQTSQELCLTVQKNTANNMPELDNENTYTDAAQGLSCFFRYHSHQFVSAGV